MPLPTGQVAANQPGNSVDPFHAHRPARRVLGRCLAVFEQDGVAGKVVRKEVAWDAAFAKAESLSRRVGVRQACRSFDLLHVAISAVSTVKEFKKSLTDSRASGLNRL